jgi:hypothetical protein
MRVHRPADFPAIRFDSLCAAALCTNKIKVARTAAAPNETFFIGLLLFY